MSRAISPNGRVLQHPGDLQWLERRRLQAAELFAQGKTKAEVAGELGVSAQTVSRWYARWRDGGVAGMRTARQGKPAQLGPAELAKVKRVLDRGAVQARFDNDLWTLARVAEVIEQVAGVTHHPGHVWRILKQMRWSLQRPARKAVERDEAQIARWVAEEWPHPGVHPRAGRPGPAARPPAGTVIWDNPRRHHAGDLDARAAGQPWLELVYLPSYAPVLNPVEPLWSNLKGYELANRCCADRAELIATAQDGSIRVRRDPELLRSFLAGTPLTL
jgi:transposase